MSFEIKSATELMQFSKEDVDIILSKYERRLDTVREDIDAIKKWFLSQKHLPVTPAEQQIFIFLVMSKFSIEKTKEKFDMYYTIRHLIPDYYSDLTPSAFTIKEMQKTIQLATLPKLSKDLNRVIVAKIVDTKNPNFNSFGIFQYLLLFLEMKSLFDVSCSDEYLLDYSNITVAMVAKYSVMDIKKIVTIIEKVFSNRIVSIHLLHLPSYAEILISIMRSCLKEKLRNRFHYHNKMETLHEFFPKEMLPKDFEGGERSLAELHDDWIKFLDKNEDHFVRMQKIKVDEALRATGLVNDDVLGFHGNFRQLNVD